jgi:hypothetical protein
MHSGLNFIKIGNKIIIFFLGHLYSFPIRDIVKFNEESEPGEKK